MAPPLRPLLASIPTLALGTSARADAPMWYLETFGSPGHEIQTITWALLILSVAVVLIIALLVIYAVATRARGNRPMTDDRFSVKPSEDRKALPWIYSGLALTAVILLALTAWTVGTLAAIVGPGSQSDVTVDVIAHQWWWELRYSDGNPAHSFETANEIHIPVGQPVRFRLNSGDVIHSFWVPALGGKTDLIPGQENTAWLRADTAGVYRGQCAEYCGLEHAKMALRVFADPPEQFAAWWKAQLAPAPEPRDERAAAGQRTFQLNCSACHAVRGTPAGGQFGPSLTHLMSRSTIAANVLPNTIGYLSGWIANPQALKPGTTMPNPDLSGPELDAVRSYLLTLK